MSPRADALECWEVVAHRAALLTVHRAPLRAAEDYAELVAGKLPGTGNVVKLRCVARCTCHYTTHGAQPAKGGVRTIAAPYIPAREG